MSDSLIYTTQAMFPLTYFDAHFEISHLNKGERKWQHFKKVLKFAKKFLCSFEKVFARVEKQLMHKKKDGNNRVE